jgi:serine/threonine protein kinase
MLSVTSASMTKRIGTTRWTAPEILNGLHYSEKADVFSFGMVLYEIFARKLPFYEEMWDSKVEEHIVSGLRPELPTNVPSLFSDMLIACWHAEPQRRPTFVRIIEAIETGSSINL